MAKRKTPTTDLGEIRNPIKAAALITCANAHRPLEITRRADGVLCTFFNPTEQFLQDSYDYDKNDLAVFGVKRFLLVRRRLLDMKEYGDVPRLPELADTVIS